MRLSSAALAGRYKTPDASELAAQWLANLVAVAAEKQGVKDSDSAGTLIKDTAKQMGVPPQVLGGLAGKTENGDLVYIHQEVGSGARFAGAVRTAGSTEIRAFTGCFRGTMDEFAAKVTAKYPSGEIADQYAGFMAAAKQSFSHGTALPTLDEAISGRVHAWQVKNLRARNFG